jgi:hypothetical protein
VWFGFAVQHRQTKHKRDPPTLPPDLCTLLPPQEHLHPRTTARIIPEMVEMVCVMVVADGTAPYAACRAARQPMKSFFQAETPRSSPSFSSSPTGEDPPGRARPAVVIFTFPDGRSLQIDRDKPKSLTIKRTVAPEALVQFAVQATFPNVTEITSKVDFNRRCARRKNCAIGEWTPRIE